MGRLPESAAALVIASGAAEMETTEAGLPISSAMACSNCARCTPTSMACAWVVLSWVCACRTSALETTPLAYRLLVSSKISETPR